MSQLQVTGEAKIRDLQGPVVANDGVITALDGAASQYVRGDGTLADFPTSSGGGSSVSYYLNSSVSQGTIGGVAYRELSKDPIIGGGTDIAISSNGYVANYITDVNDPDVIIVPGGNFNCEFYFSVNNNTGNPFTYAELYKYDGTTFTLLGSSVGVPEYINQGTIIAPYYFAIPVPTSALALTDRLAIRIYVNVDGRTVTLHTENSHLCQVVTTLSKGMVSLNNLTDQSQNLTTGTSGTNFAIVSSGDTHTFNLPIASATNTGKLSSTDWSTFNNKVPYTGATADVDLGNFILSAPILKASVSSSASGSLILYTGSTGFSYGNTAITLVSSPTQLNTLNIIFDIAGTQKRANIIGNSITSTRNYTLPDASGTFALTSNLSSYVPYTGATADVDLGVNFLKARTFYAEGNGGGGSYAIKNGATPSFEDGYTILSSNDYRLNILSTVSSVTKAVYLGFSGVTATRTFTFPDLSGTLALLEGTQTFSGSKTFSNLLIGERGIVLSAGTTTFVAGSTSLNGNANGLTIALGVTVGGTTTSYAHQLLFPQITPRTYTFPAASGTVALTSDVPSVSGTATYIPVFTGVNSLGNSQIWNNGGIIGMGTNYSSPAFSVVASSGDTLTQGKLAINATSFSGASVLQVNGAATLTGALSGTSATFSGGLVAGLTGGAVTAGDLTVDTTSTAAKVIVGRLSSVGSDNTTFIIRNRIGTQGVVMDGFGNASFLGNVGIGTSSPSNLLTLNQSSNSGSGSGYPLLNVTNTLATQGDGSSTFNFAGLLVQSGNGAVQFFHSTSFASGTWEPQALLNVATNHPLIIRTNNTERMRITSGGAVYINGTAGTIWTSSSASIAQISMNDTFPLTIAKNDNLCAILNRTNSTGGILEFKYNGSTVGSISYNGSITVLNPTSDKRLKENIVDAGSGLDKLSKIKIRAYDWKQSGMHTDFGIIAQEIFEVAPECVKVGSDEVDSNGNLKDPWCAQPYVLVSAAVKAIQELNQLVQELEARIKQLENK